jgi:hypothetical protein
VKYKAIKKLFISISFLTVICASILVFFLICKKEKPTTPNKGVVIFQQGKSYRVQNNKKEPLKIRDFLIKGDEIRTSKESNLTLQVIGLGVIRLQEKTKILFSKLLEEGETEMFLESGKVMSKILKSKKAKSFSIKTATAVAAVRGTQLSVKTDKSGETTIAVAEGKVSVKKPEMKDEVIVKEGKAVDLKPKQKKIKVRKITPIEKTELKKVADVKIIEAIEEISQDELSSIIKEFEKKEKQINKKLKKIALKSKPKTLKQIKETFNRLDLIILYSGKKIKGAIIKSTPTSLVIYTKNGTIKIPKSKVKSKSPLK